MPSSSLSASAPYTVQWSTRALAEIDRLRDYITAQGSPAAAERMAVQLKKAGDSLERFPERGRTAGKARELATVPPYLIRYRITGSRVTILRVKHGAQRP